jgi:hypothetical protein
MARRKQLCDVCEDADELYWRRHRLVANWVAEEWALWQQETGQKLTVSQGGLRKRLHELLDTILDADDDLMRAGEAKRAAREAAAAAKVVPLRSGEGPHA